jgi:glyoxylase-like metal-dependent hydrolase (beta-lactamase superfamily II)
VQLLWRFINRRWLINTHCHFDHADGSSTFADEGTTVIANANCRKSDEHCRCWMTKPH